MDTNRSGKENYNMSARRLRPWNSAMRLFANISDTTIWFVAMSSAAFLLFGLVAPRTSWTRGRQAQTAEISTDGAGWDYLVALGGMIAIFALCVIIWSHRFEYFAAICAIGAFTFAAFAAGSYAIMIFSGALADEAAERGSKWILHATPAPPFFATAACIGLVCTTIFAIRCWRTRPEN